MVLDYLNQYCSGQTLTSTGASTNALDHGSDRNIGIGEPLVAVVTVTAIDATSSDETYTATLQTDSDPAFGSVTAVTPAVTIARGVTVPYRAVIPVPPDTATKRYTRMTFTLGGTTPSITVTAELIPQSFLQNEQYFPSGFAVS